MKRSWQETTLSRVRNQHWRSIILACSVFHKQENCNALSKGIGREIQTWSKMNNTPRALQPSAKFMKATFQPQPYNSFSFPTYDNWTLLKDTQAAVDGRETGSFSSKATPVRHKTNVFFPFCTCSVYVWHGM